MMTILKYLILLFVLFAQVVFAAEKDPKQKTHLRQLKVEHRLHLRAQSFANTVNVFDDLGLLGRGVDVRPAAPLESISSSEADDRLPGISFVPSSDAQGTYESFVEPEMDESVLHLDLRMEIEALEKALSEARVKRPNATPDQQKK